MLKTLSNFYDEVRKEKVKWIIMASAVAVLGIVVVYPIGILFWKSLLDKAGNFTFSNYIAVFTEPGLSTAFKNTMILAFWTTIACTALGMPMAFAVARTNMPLKNLISAAVLISFVIPSFIQAIAWILLLGPRAGMINVFLKKIFGLPWSATIFDIFGMAGLVFVLTLNFYPLIFYCLIAALNNMDPSYEEAARMVGAKSWQSALGITFPLVTPALLTGIILVFLDGVAAFGAPIAIGLPARIPVITTKIYQLFTYPPRYELAAACATPIVVLTALGLILQKYYIGKKEFVTVTGKARAPEPIDIGKWKYVLLAFCLLVVFVAVVLPLFILIRTSLTKVWGLSLSLENFTLENYTMLFDPKYYVRGSIINSFYLGAVAATFCVILCMVICWMIERGKVKGSAILSFLCMITFAFPASALAVGILLGFMVHPFNLQGTLTIIGIGYVSKRISYSFVLIRNTMKQIHTEFEEAARLVGATWLQSTKDVLMPLLKTGIIVAWILVFAVCLRELTLAILLFLPGNETMAVSIFNLLDDGALEGSATVAVVLSIMSIAAVLGVRKIAGKGVMEI